MLDSFCLLPTLEYSFLINAGKQRAWIVLMMVTFLHLFPPRRYVLVAMRSGAGLAVRTRRKTLIRRQSRADLPITRRTRAATDTDLGVAFGVTNLRRNHSTATGATSGIGQVSTLALFRHTCVDNHEVLASFFSKEHRWNTHLHRGVVLLTCN